MANRNEAVPMESAGFASDLAGLPSFFIDPAGAAKRVHSKWFWIVPFLICSIIAIGVGLYMAPLILHVATVAPIPEGVTADQHATQVAMTGMFTKIGAFAAPVFIAILWALVAGILMGISVVAGVTGRFGEYFNLVAGCGVIQSLQSIATAVILHFKGEISTAAELRPAMGLDILMPEGANKYLMAAGGAFSVFQIWWLVMLALIYSAAFRVSKGKAFGVVIPIWIVGMLLGMLGAVFQK